MTWRCILGDMFNHDCNLTTGAILIIALFLCVVYIFCMSTHHHHGRFKPTPTPIPAPPPPPQQKEEWYVDLFDGSRDSQVGIGSIGRPQNVDGNPNTLQVEVEIIDIDHKNKTAIITFEGDPNEIRGWRLEKYRAPGSPLTGPEHDIKISDPSDRNLDGNIRVHRIITDANGNKTNERLLTTRRV